MHPLDDIGEDKNQACAGIGGLECISRGRNNGWRRQESGFGIVRVPWNVLWVHGRGCRPIGCESDISALEGTCGSLRGLNRGIERGRAASADERCIV